MAIVSCPECQKRLKVADTSVGKKVKCSCGQIFAAQTESAAATPIPVAAPSDKVVVSCTECGAKLRVVETSLGKKMKCPSGRGRFHRGPGGSPRPRPESRRLPPMNPKSSMIRRPKRKPVLRRRTICSPSLRANPTAKRMRPKRENQAGHGIQRRRHGRRRRRDAHAEGENQEGRPRRGRRRLRRSQRAKPKRARSRPPPRTPRSPFTRAECLPICSSRS